MGIKGERSPEQSVRLQGPDWLPEMDGHCPKTHTGWHWGMFLETLDCTKMMSSLQSLSHSTLLLLPQNLLNRIKDTVIIIQPLLPNLSLLSLNVPESVTIS